MDLYLGKLRFTTDLEGDDPPAAMPHPCAGDAVSGAICACAELSALVFDLPDEVLVACGEGWTALHRVLVPRMDVISNGPDDCSLLPDADILREARGTCPTLPESDSTLPALPPITLLSVFPNAEPTLVVAAAEFA
jgi:hypothetical protein